MSKWIWAAAFDITRDGIKYRLKFQTEDLKKSWDEGIESQKTMVQHNMWTNREKTKAFVWYFESESKKREFLDAFRQSIDRMRNPAEPSGEDSGF